MGCDALTDVATLEIEGLDKLSAKLEAVGKRLESEFFAAGKSGMQIYVEGPAKENCPIDEGRLRGSIVTVKEGDTIKTGTNVKYGPDVEFGTGIHAENGQGRQTPWVYYYSGHKGNPGFRTTHGQPAQPFLRPAFDSGKQDVIEYVKDQLRKAIRT